jgi:hypothetical protein
MSNLTISADKGARDSTVLGILFILLIEILD